MIQSWRINCNFMINFYYIVVLIKVSITFATRKEFRYKTQVFLVFLVKWGVYARHFGEVSLNGLPYWLRTAIQTYCATLNVDSTLETPTHTIPLLTSTSAQKIVQKYMKNIKKQKKTYYFIWNIKYCSITYEKTKITVPKPPLINCKLTIW